MIDWATSRLGEPWSFTRREHIDTHDGWVITSPKTLFTPRGLKVTIGNRAPWFPISLGERTVDTKKFHRMQIRVRANSEGKITLRTHSPGYESHVRIDLDPGIRVTTKWQTFDLDLRKAKGGPWGGPEGAIDKIYFLLDFPLDKDVEVEISRVKLLGTGKADREPPVITPLPDREGSIRFRIADPAGILASSLLMVVNDVVYGPRSKALRWNGKVLSWKGRFHDHRDLAVSVEVCDREGNRASLEVERTHVLPASGKRPTPLRTGFRSQRRSHTATLKDGKGSRRIRIGGAHQPVNRSIEIRGPVANPKVLIDGNTDFETPKTIVSSILDGRMSVEEKARRIWQFVMKNVYVMGMGNPVDRTKYLNSCGYGFCGSQAPVQMALYEAAGVPWMHVLYVWPLGHLSVQVFYDGRWHIIDSMNRGYFLTDNGRTIASAEEIEGDPDIIGPTQGAMIPLYREHLRWPRVRYRFEGKGDELKSGSMDTRLRKNESLRLTWAPLGRWCHAPSEPVDYVNGRLTFRPLDGTAQWKKDAESVSNIAYSGKEGALHPVRPGRPAHVIYRMHSPYLMAGGHVKLDCARNGARNTIAASISTDGGAHWKEIWKAGRDDRGENQIDLTRWMSRRCVEEDMPLFRDVHDFLLRVEPVQKGRRAPQVHDLTIVPVLQVHAPSLQKLRRGDNTCRYAGVHMKQGRVEIDHDWDEADAIRVSNERPARGEKVTLSATVRNDETGPVGPLTVRFFDGHPDAGGAQIGKPIKIRSIPPRRSVRVKTTWTAEPRANRPLAEAPRRYLHTDIYAAADLPRNRAPSPGYASMNRIRLHVTDRPRLDLPASAIRVEPEVPRSGRTATVSVIVWNISAQKCLAEQPEYVYWNGAELKDVRVRFYHGNPRTTGRRIGERTIRRIRPCEHGTARIRWRIPGNVEQLDIYAVASHETGPASAHQKKTVRKRIQCAMIREQSERS